MFFSKWIFASLILSSIYVNILNSFTKIPLKDTISILCKNTYVFWKIDVSFILVYSVLSSWKLTARHWWPSIIINLLRSQAGWLWIDWKNIIYWVVLILWFIRQNNICGKYSEKSMLSNRLFKTNNNWNEHNDFI